MNSKNNYIAFIFKFISIFIIIFIYTHHTWGSPSILALQKMNFGWHAWGILRMTHLGALFKCRRIISGIMNVRVGARFGGLHSNTEAQTNTDTKHKTLHPTPNNQTSGNQWRSLHVMITPLVLVRRSNGRLTPKNTYPFVVCIIVLRLLCPGVLRWLSIGWLLKVELSHDFTNHSNE